VGTAIAAGQTGFALMASGGSPKPLRNPKGSLKSKKERRRLVAQ
jgi:hypothetical protein